MKKLLCIIVLLPWALWGQKKWNQDLKVMVNYQTGFGLPEYSALTYLYTDYSKGFEVSVFKQRYGRDPYEQIYKYPENGVAFTAMTLGNRKLLGNAFALDYFFHINLIHTPKFRLYNRMGIGLSYLTNKYSVSQNQMNVVIGSHVNIHFNCRFGLGYRLTENLELTAGASFDHYSNGNTAEPNIGLNYLNFFGGAIVNVGPKTPLVHSEIPPHQRNFFVEAYANVGAKHTRTFSGHYYPAFSAGAEVTYALFRGFHLDAGVDLFYDTSIKDQLADLNRPYQPSNSIQSGIHVSQSVVYRKFRFTLQEGVYVGFTEPIKHHVMYNRGILKYNITDRWSIRIAMKSHLHILDYPELGFGVKL